MQDTDVAWAQSVVNRWATEKAVPAPRVMTIMDSGGTVVRCDGRGNDEADADKVSQQTRGFVGCGLPSAVIELRSWL